MCSEMHVGLHVKHPLFLPDFYETFSRKIFDKFSDTKFNQNPSSGAEVFYMDRRTVMTKLIVALRNFTNAPNKLTSQTILLPKKKLRALLYTISALLKVITISQDFTNYSPCNPLLHIQFIWDIFKFYPPINTQTIKLNSALQAINYNSIHIHASLLFTIRCASKIYIASSFDKSNALLILKSPCRSQISSSFALHQPRITALLVLNSPTSALLFMWYTKFYISTKLQAKITFPVLAFQE